MEATRNEEKIFRGHYEQDEFIGNLSSELEKIFNENIVILNIGTDRSTGDSLGPLIGTFLNEFNFGLPVYGTLESPAHAKNLTEIINTIKNNHSNPLIIAIDACLGSEKKVGDIVFKKGSIKPGAGAGKKLPECGNYSIYAIVNFCSSSSGFGGLNGLILGSTRLDKIYKMAKYIAESLIIAEKEFKNKNLKELI